MNSIGLGLIVGELGRHEDRVLDLRGIAAHVFAVPVYDVYLVPVQAQGHSAKTTGILAAHGEAVQVPQVAVLCQGAQCSALTQSADHDGYVRLLERRGRQRRAVELVKAALEIDRPVGGEQRANQGAGFLETVLALAHRRVLPAVGFVLAFEPRRADTQRKSTVGDLIDRRGHLGEEGRIAVGVACHEMSETELFGHAGGGGDQRPGFVHGLVLRPLPRLGRNEVVGEP